MDNNQVLGMSKIAAAIMRFESVNVGTKDERIMQRGIVEGLKLAYKMLGGSVLNDLLVKREEPDFQSEILK